MKHQSLAAHLAEIAEESGVDLLEETAVSHEHVSRRKGLPPIDVWYQEAATWKPWRAFLAGVGTCCGWDAKEAADRAADKAIERVAAGGLVGREYLDSLK